MTLAMTAARDTGMHHSDVVAVAGSVTRSAWRLRGALCDPATPTMMATVRIAPDTTHQR